jgi:hypothetical protein
MNPLEDLLKNIESKDEVLIKILKQHNEDILRLKTENLILKKIVIGVLGISEDIFKI